MDWDLAQLRAFAAVVDEGTFDSAAATLHVTPSAISQRIKALELAAGRILLVRSRPVRPTEAGQPILRLARQIRRLTEDTEAEVAADAGRVRLSLAVNADTLSSWLLPILAPLAGEVTFDLHRADQSNTAALLRDGTVVAAVTADREPPAGCRSTLLGRMIYRPLASPRYRDDWFADGPTRQALGRAPAVVFDQADDLQHRYLRHRRCRPGAEPPLHLVPASADFVQAVELGFGWGMVPDGQRPPGLVEIDPGFTLPVTLYWQQWKLASPALDHVARAVLAGAAAALA